MCSDPQFWAPVEAIEAAVGAIVGAGGVVA